jgi:hypothetical protein
MHDIKYGTAAVGHLDVLFGSIPYRTYSSKLKLITWTCINLVRKSLLRIVVQGTAGNQLHKY